MSPDDMKPTSEIQSMNEIIDAPVAPLAATSPTPTELLRLAIQTGGLDVDRMERLMAMEERWTAKQAEKAFLAALAAFQGEHVQVVKGKTVDFATSKGRTTYTHAELHHVIDAAGPVLARHGLSLRWHPRREGARVIVRTILSHVAGHSEHIELEGGLDDSGNKNSLQQSGSTQTYLQRYGAMAILGLASKDQPDDDGAGAGAVDGELLAAGRAASMDGTAALAAWWKAITKDGRQAMSAQMPTLKSAAETADGAR